MAAEHFHPPRPAQFASGAFPVPNLPCPVLGQETPVLDFVSNAFLHWKVSDHYDFQRNQHRFAAKYLDVVPS
jgi:hypothetical protein